MASAAEHLLAYDRLRATVLARHMALGRYHRANLLSLKNHLKKELPLKKEDLEQLPQSDREVLERWNVSDHERENPLILSAHLHTALAVEHALGSTTAQPILRRSLEAIASLVPLAGPLRGYITRWDAASTDRWNLDPGGRPELCHDFFIDDQGRYQMCDASTDPRHVARRSLSTLRALRTRADADSVKDDNGNGMHWAYVDRHRRWETSADELCGLFAGWAVVDRLVPGLASLVRPQAIAVAERLAANGWTQIRPCGGFGARGSSGVLVAFDLPVDHWIRHIVGSSAGAASAIDFDEVLRRAGYWSVLAGPIGAMRALAVAGNIALGPLLLQAGVLPSALGGIIAAASHLIGPYSVGLIAALAANGDDCMDVWDASEAKEPAIAALLCALSPRERLSVFFQYANLTAGPAGGYSSNFPPLLALLALDDPTSPVIAPYLQIIRRRRGVPPTGLEEGGLDGALSTAVAVVLGATELVPVLVAQLDARHDFFAANNFDAPLDESDPADPTKASEKGIQSIILVLDYLAALALAWLHASRSSNAPAGLAQPSTEALNRLLEPSVPAIVMQHLPEVREVALGSATATYGGGDFPLFSGVGDRPKEQVTHAAAIPPVPTGAPWEFTYTVPRWMRDVPTDVVLNGERDYEIIARGLVDGLGPDGGEPCDDIKWPLHRGLDANARQGALLAYVGGYVQIGTETGRRRFLGWGALPLFLRINRPRRDIASNEGFQVTVRIWGPPPETVPAGRVVTFVRRPPGVSKRGRIIGIGGMHDDHRVWYLERDEAIKRIRDYGQRFNVRTSRGPSIGYVGGGSRRRYLRSKSDGSSNNNLKSLPDG